MERKIITMTKNEYIASIMLEAVELLRSNGTPPPNQKILFFDSRR